MAERRAGELLENDTDIVKGSNQMSHGVTSEKPLTGMGISRNQSSKWQKIASITENLINTNQR